MSGVCQNAHTYDIKMHSLIFLMTFFILVGASSEWDWMIVLLSLESLYLLLTFQ